MSSIRCKGGIFAMILEIGEASGARRWGLGIRISCFCDMEDRLSQSCSRIINFLLVFTKRYLL